MEDKLWIVVFYAHYATLTKLQVTSMIFDMPVHFYFFGGGRATDLASMMQSRLYQLCDHLELIVSEAS